MCVCVCVCVCVYMHIHVFAFMKLFYNKLKVYFLQRHIKAGYIINHTDFV